MKKFRNLGLVGVTAAALMAFAASASADYVSLVTGGPAETSTIHAVSENGHVTLATPIANISCASTVDGYVSSHGSGSNVDISLSNLTFTGCTNSWHVTGFVSFLGSLEIESTGGHNGHVYSTNSRIVATRFGLTCTYETNNTTMGSFTGGNPATLHIEGEIPAKGAESSGLCGLKPALWEGNYVMTSSLYVVNS